MRSLVFFCLLLVAMAIACSTESEIIEVTRIFEGTVEVTVEVTRVVSEVTEVEVTRLVEVEVTRLVEVLPTQETASIAAAEPAEPFAKFSSQEVANAFKAAGLESENLRPMTRDDYGSAPFVGEGTRFFIPSLGEGSGGRVIAVDSLVNREALRTYYESLGQQSALFFSWVFVRDNIVVQINGDLSEDDARQYEAVLNSLP